SGRWRHDMGAAQDQAPVRGGHRSTERERVARCLSGPPHPRRLWGRRRGGRPGINGSPVPRVPARPKPLEVYQLTGVFEAPKWTLPWRTLRIGELIASGRPGTVSLPLSCVGPSTQISRTLDRDGRRRTKCKVARLVGISEGRSDSGQSRRLGGTGRNHSHFELWPCPRAEGPRGQRGSVASAARPWADVPVLDRRVDLLP